MKALVLKRYGGLDTMEFCELPRPAIKPDEILVQIHAAALNPVDLMIAKGAFKPLMPVTLPQVVGSDLAGTVIETGSSVTRFKRGDAVFASIFDLPGGSMAELAAVPERAAAHKPDNLDFVQAASIPMVGLTSWQAMRERMQLKRGQKVFIPAGSGGIGTFAIQLAKHLGAIVGTSTSSANLTLVRSLGADEVVDYKQQQVQQVLQGYDAILGTLRGDALDKSLAILRPGSKVVSLIGPPDAAFARARGMNFFMKAVFGLLSAGIIRRASKRGASYSFLFVRPDGGTLGEIGALLAGGQIKPVIDKVFAFEQAKEGLAYLEQGRARGKVVVQLQ